MVSTPLGTEQVVSSIPGSVGYISHVHWAYDYLGPFEGLWAHMAWHKNCVETNKKNKSLFSENYSCYSARGCLPGRGGIYPLGGLDKTLVERENAISNRLVISGWSLLRLHGLDFKPCYRWMRHEPNKGSASDYTVHRLAAVLNLWSADWCHVWC